MRPVLHASSPQGARKRLSLLVLLSLVEVMPFPIYGHYVTVLYSPVNKLSDIASV